MIDVFVSTSFSDKVDEHGDVLPEHRAEIEPVLAAIQRSGRQYFCAVEDSGWRMLPVDPKDEFRRDLDLINECTTMIALLDTQLSAGVQLEMGYMLSKIEADSNKQLVIAYPSDVKPAWSNAAVAQLPNISLVSYQSAEDIVAALN